MALNSHWPLLHFVNPPHLDGAARRSYRFKCKKTFIYSINFSMHDLRLLEFLAKAFRCIALFSMLGGPGGTGCDWVRFPVPGGWDSRDVSVGGVCVWLCQRVYEFWNLIDNLVYWLGISHGSLYTHWNYWKKRCLGDFLMDRSFICRDRLSGEIRFLCQGIYVNVKEF